MHFFDIKINKSFSTFEEYLKYVFNNHILFKYKRFFYIKRYNLFEIYEFKDDLNYYIFQDKNMGDVLYQGIRNQQLYEYFNIWIKEFNLEEKYKNFDFSQDFNSKEYKQIFNDIEVNVQVK